MNTLSQPRDSRLQNGQPVNRRFRRRGAFTLIEILIVIAIIGVLAALAFAVLGGGRESARRAQCDTNLKALAIALDAFRQENGRYPAALEELEAGKYITDPAVLRCPDDPDSDSNGYADYYVQRGIRNDPRYPRLTPVGELPLIVCPFHEEQGHGAQAFAGLNTQQFAVQPAVLVSANATEIKRPGEEVVPAQAGMKLHGGDRIQTGGGGMALVRFADGSTCELGAGSDVTVLQSFLSGGQSTLYTVVRQTVGDVGYTVNHGSKFDVSTPTATAGALGTEFRIKIEGLAEFAPNETSAVAPSYSESWINTSVAPTSEVYCSTPGLNTVIERHQWVPIDPAHGGPGNPKPRKSKDKNKDDKGGKGKD